MSKEERFIYHCDNYDYDEIIYDTKKGYDYVSLQTVAKTLNKQDAKITDLEAKLAEFEKAIIAYEKIVEEKDKELSFANRDKTCIVKQLNDPNAYVSLEEYKRIEQQLVDTEAQNKRVLEKLELIVRDNQDLQKQLAEKEKENKALKYLSGCPNDINEMVRKVVYRDEQLCKQYDFFQKQLERANQDKIELLEKVESYIKDSTYIKEPDYTNVCEYIRTLIKEIKGE